MADHWHTCKTCCGQSFAPSSGLIYAGCAQPLAGYADHARNVSRAGSAKLVMATCSGILTPECLRKRSCWKSSTKPIKHSVPLRHLESMFTIWPAGIYSSAILLICFTFLFLDTCKYLPSGIISCHGTSVLNIKIFHSHLPSVPL